MTDDAPTPSDALNAALTAILPQLRQGKSMGWIGVALAVLAVPVAMVLLHPHFQDDMLWLWAPPVAAGFLAYVIHDSVARRHAALVMPNLAQAIGLAYDQKATGFVSSLPARLMPDMVVQASDLLTGQIGGRPVSFAEVDAETGGKNSKTIFRGFVIRMPNLVPMPPLFIAPVEETERGFLRPARLKVTDLVHLKSLPMPGGRTFGIWGSSDAVTRDPGFDVLVEVLTEFAGRPEGALRLYSATVNGEITHLAVEHDRDLFRIGGLFAQDSDVMGQVRRAFDDLRLPVDLTKTLLDAESKVLARRQAAGLSAGQAVSPSAPPGRSASQSASGEAHSAG